MSEGRVDPPTAPVDEELIPAVADILRAVLTLEQEMTKMRDLLIKQHALLREVPPNMGPEEWYERRREAYALMQSYVADRFPPQAT